MTVLGGIGFASPWLLLGLIALPILWITLRAVPPAPIRRRFPGVALLLGLKDDESVSDRTPWWLLLLRMLAIAAAIIGLAGPVLNPSQGQSGSGPLLIVLDASWAGATDWSAKTDLISSQLAEAGRANRPVAILRLSAPEAAVFQSADVWRNRLAGLEPNAWQPTSPQLADAIAKLKAIDGGFDTHWFSDGLSYPDQSGMLDALSDRGTVQVFQTGRDVLGIAPTEFEDGSIKLTALRAQPGTTREVILLAHGRDPAGNAQVLASVPARFEPAEVTATATLTLPSELRARITRFEIQGQHSAGAQTLTDDSLRRREIALIAGRESREGLQLLSPLHYLNQALSPTAELLTGALLDILPANPDVIVLADVATLSDTEEQALIDWVEAGGMLLRFAGPRLAGSDISRSDQHPLMPVRLRTGGRNLGGAMTWGQPKALAPFPEGSPFFGLTIPDDVSVTAQVMAQPDPTLADRVIASLNDGTPLVTRKDLGQGQIVLFHVTANAEWSSLPLSGLFVEMLERLAVSSSAKSPIAADLEGTIWTPVQVMDGFGRLSDAANLPGVDGPALIDSAPGPDLRPGLYVSGDKTLARNVLTTGSILSQAVWPDSIAVHELTVDDEKPLAGILLSIAIVLLVLDVIASLALSGRLGLKPATTAMLAVMSAAMLITTDPGTAFAQQTDESFALAATSELTLAHVLTGDAELDEIAQAGLRGLSDVLFRRTSIEPSLPVGIDLERDELSFFPLLYWPVTPDQPMPSDEAYAKLNAFIRSGGLILFDTRDSDISHFGAASQNGRKLQQLAKPLDIPPLEPLPKDHVLTRTFYLLQDYPGRHNSPDVWVESAPPDAKQIEGMPFRNLNDGVTPVVIGGNDWAGAWATDPSGRPLLPVGRGFAGTRQRELAYRFGVNLVMHVLTGNYKSDQVHVPALLDRLGQ
ncbi:MAG: DUF4159 domain-containing protein [Rhodobacteraceae bacterium]|nr:DUF4159 domain-containing protein [Paracoccaceae bacterium]